MDNLTPINPAWSMMNIDGGTVNSTVRKQWIGINGAPSTYMFNLTLPIKSVSGSFGVVLMDDQLAVEHKTECNIFFAKSITLSQTQSLAVSINAGFYRYTTQYANLDPNDPAIQNDIVENRPNAGFGIMFYSKTYYLGLSVPQITIRELGSGTLVENNYFRNSYYFEGGYQVPLDDDFKMKPATLVSFTRGVPVIADISNMFYLKNVVGLGLNYRTNNEVAVLSSVDIDAFHIGYSYQFGASSLNVGGIHFPTNEFSLAFHFGRRAKSMFAFP